jgi:hypothetical protein
MHLVGFYYKKVQRILLQTRDVGYEMGTFIFKRLIWSRENSNDELKA